MPSRGAEHPRAFALAPGGDSGAVPTTMAIRAGAEWPLQTGAGTPQLPRCNIRVANDRILIQINRASEPNSGVRAEGLEFFTSDA